MREHLKTYIDRGNKPNVRALRILLEFFYATEIFDPLKVKKIPIVSVFGSARMNPRSTEYKRARTLGSLLYQSGFSVVTGASRGVMEAANQGVGDAIAAQLVKEKKAGNIEEAYNTRAYKALLRKYSLGLRITLPFEENENPWVGVAGTFHYFMVRKFFFANLSRAFIACEGGWGTRDELYEMLTLVQTGKSPLMPIIYMSRDPSHLEADLKHTLDNGHIHKADLHLINIVKTPTRAVDIISKFYRRVEHIKLHKNRNVRIHFHKQPSNAMKSGFNKVWKRYAKYFSGFEWKGITLELYAFSGGSYGTLRLLIDHLNRL